MQHRRLVGPTVISLILLALLADHLFLSQLPWSVSRFLGKFFAVFTAIFTPAVDPALYSWIADILLPVSFAALVLVVLSLSVARAKRAMRRATPDAADKEAATAGKSLPPMASDVSDPMLLSSARERHYSLLGKLVVSIGSVGVLFGFIACLIVYAFLSRAIEREVQGRVDVMALGLGEVVAPLLEAGRVDEATAAVEKYASNNTVAYVYIEDVDGRMIAHWPNDLPRYLRRDFPNSTKRALQGTDGEYRGVHTYEVARRVREEKLGFVHVAMGRGVVGSESQHVVTAIAAAMFLVLLCVLGGFLWIARSLHRPLAELVDHAAQISKGDFAVPLALQRTDELGEIARSLERLRSSLRAVTARLDTGRLNQRSGE